MIVYVYLRLDGGTRLGGDGIPARGYARETNGWPGHLSHFHAAAACGASAPMGIHIT